MAAANDWARGFMRGVELRREAWADLIASEEHGGSILPMLMLYHEHDPHPEMRPNPNRAGTTRGNHRPHDGGAVANLPPLLEPTPVLDPAPHIVTDRSPGDGQGRAQRSVPLRLRQEVQALPRRHDTTLAQLFTASGFRFGFRLP